MKLHPHTFLATLCSVCMLLCCAMPVAARDGRNNDNADPPQRASAPFAIDLLGPPPRPETDDDDETSRALIRVDRFFVFPVDPLALEEPSNIPSAIARGLAAPFFPVINRPIIHEDALLSRWPAMLSLDLSFAELNPEYELPRIGRDTPVLRNFYLPRLMLLAEPVFLVGSVMQFRARARDARFELVQDKKGRYVLALAEAQEGELETDIALADLEWLLQTQLHSEMARHGMRLHNLQLQLQSPADNQLHVDLRATIIVGLFPARLHLKGMISIDEDFNVVFTELYADGDDLLGWLVTGIISPSFRKNEGKVRPLISFPSPLIRLHHVRVHVDDKLHIEASFGP